MKKIKISILLLLFSCCMGWCQQLTPTVIASAGTHFNSGISQLSWTLGETVTETISSGSGQTATLTQGFHQPLLNFNKIITLDSDQNFSIYPNPSQGYFIIDFKEYESDHDIEILDVLGRVVYKNIKETNVQALKINTEEFSSGNYLLRISNEKKSTLHISKFIISN